MSTRLRAERVSLADRFRRLGARRGLHFLTLALITTALSCGLRAQKGALGNVLDAFALDGYFKLRGALPPQKVSENRHTRDIVLVETTHQLPRPVLARLLRQLKEAKVVAFDMMFVDEEKQLAPDDLTPQQKTAWYGAELQSWRRDDAILANAIRTQKRVVLGTWPDETRANNLVISPNAPSLQAPSSTRSDNAPLLTWQKPPDVLWKAAYAHAHLLVAPDAQDGTVRSVRLYDGPPNARQPALGLALAAAAQNVSPRELAAKIAQMNPSGGVLEIGKSLVPYGRDGETWIDFAGARASFDGNRIAYNRVLDDDYSAPEDFKNKIVLIGEASETSKEIMATPFEQMPGMQIHANVAATLLDETVPLQTLPDFWIAIIAFATSLILPFPLLRFSLWTSFVVGIVECAVLFFFGAWMFAQWRLILPISVPVGAIFLMLNALALYEYRRARRTLGSFIGNEMVPHALGLFAQLRLGGRTEDATAWFCDLRGYSSLSENMAAQNVGDLLAQYTETIVRIVRKHGGRPIDYQGDGVFVLFEAAKTDHAQRAVLAAIETQSAFHELHEKWELRDKVPLEIAIGMATGALMIGLVGSTQHLKMGAVGDAVNVASRVQALSRECGFPILLARSTYDRVLDLFPFVPCGSFAVHGRTQPIEVFGLGENAAQRAPSDKTLHNMSAANGS